MAQENPLLINCRNLLYSISKQDLPLISHEIDIVNCACKIVEEVYLRMKSNRTLPVGITGVTKKLTASELFKPLIERYHKFQLITDTQKQDFDNVCINLQGFIDSIILLWRQESGYENTQNTVRKACVCFSLFVRRSQTNYRPFEKVQILENIENIPQ
jgi:hypothetical protein